MLGDIINVPIDMAGVRYFVRGHEIDAVWAFTPCQERRFAGYQRMTSRDTGIGLGPTWPIGVSALIEAVRKVGAPPAVTDPTMPEDHPEAVAFRAWLDRLDVAADCSRHVDGFALRTESQMERMASSPQARVGCACPVGSSAKRCARPAYGGDDCGCDCHKVGA